MGKFRKNNFFALIYTPLYNPRKLVRSLKRIDDPRMGIYFFIFIFALGSIIKVILQTILSQNPTVFFLGITSMIISIPFSLVVFFMIVGFIYILLKIMGYKITFGKTLSLSSYSSSPIIFVQLPLISYIAWVYLILLLIFSFYSFLNKNLVKIGVSIIIPFLAGILGLFLFGLIP